VAVAGTVTAVQRIHARVSDEARRGWDRATVLHHATLTALLEAFSPLTRCSGWSVTHPDPGRDEAPRRARGTTGGGELQGDGAD